MAEALYELLKPSLDTDDPSLGPPAAPDETASRYLNHLSSLSLEALKSTEPQSLAQTTHTTLLSLQALSSRSYKTFITSSDNLSTLRSSVPRLARGIRLLQNAIPGLDGEAIRFSSIYSKAAENPILDRRKKAMQLARNVERLSDILELPTLLSSTVSAASASSTTLGTSTANYSSALDLYAHIRRLQTLYPDSPLIKEILLQAEDAMKEMTTNLIASLRAQTVRLAAAMRTVGWLQRVAPDLENPRGGKGSAPNEGSFGALFLVCRLANLVSTLEALDPLRELADQETQSRIQQGVLQRQSSTNVPTRSRGHQTERFLKRYIEIYREQSFAIVSLYKNIFAPEQPDAGSIPGVPNPGLRQVSLRVQARSEQAVSKSDPLQALPPAIATFPMHLVQLLTGTLCQYLPNVQDRSSRESLLTQVLYCAASLGRLGGDFSMVLTHLEDRGVDKTGEMVHEWEVVMGKHRALAGRLEQLTSGSTSAGGAPVH